MSIDTVGILSLISSDVSLISHSDSGDSTVDSLECSVDSLVIADASVFSPNDSLTTNMSGHSSFGYNKTKSKSKANSNGLDVGKADENGNEHGCNDVTDTEQGKELGQGQRKSRIPKSKTFDSAASGCSSKTIDVTHPGDKNGTGSTISRNHVFMTSQECMVVPGSSKIPRETIASRLRYEKQCQKDGTLGSMGIGLNDSILKNGTPDGYQTPSQRKDILLRDLKRQVREMRTVCEEKDREIEMYKQHVDEATSKLVEAKDEEIRRLRDELRKTQQSYDDISNFCEESISTASALEQKAEALKLAMSDREKEHQELYLEMYKRGQDSARFEREEELERLASAGGCTVTISELVKKLAWTELELAKWQTLKRQESYQDAFQPETESYTTLRFLKDAFFHYITDERDSDHHLRAMIKIFRYTDPQMVKIRESRLIELFERRNRKRLSKKARN